MCHVSNSASLVNNYNPWGIKTSSLNETSMKPRFSKEEMMRNALVPLKAIAERLGFTLSQVLAGVCMMDFVSLTWAPPQK